MASDKKDKKPDEPADAERHKLEQRVDAMMKISPTSPVFEEGEGVPIIPPGSAPAIDLKLPIEGAGVKGKGAKGKKRKSKAKTKAAKTEETPIVAEPAPEITPAEPAEPAESTETDKAAETEEVIVPETTTEDDKPDDIKPADDADDNEDPATGNAVDDIVKKESDELLDHHDEKIHKHTDEVKPPKRSFGALVKAFFKAWWHKKWARYGTILIILSALIAAGSYPPTRYIILNAVGVRTAATLSIQDQTNFQPLKNVTVEVGNHKAKTNQDGVVRLSGLELGVQSLSISQSGFANINHTVTLGWGSNPLGEFQLQPVGRQFRFKLVDYLSSKPITEAEISIGDSNAQADDKGQLILTMDKDDPTDQTATVYAEGYRDEKISLAEGEKQSRTIGMVPDKKAVFVSRASGKYDLFKIDLDGQNRKLLLAASGYEDADIQVVPRGNGEQVALVSKRDNTKNQDGYPLQTLSIVTVSNGRVLTLDHSERIQVIDWSGDKLVYVKVKAGTSAGNPNRYQLATYDFEKIARAQLASANNFNDIVAAKGTIYFAASNNFTGGVSQVVKINDDNSLKKVLIDNIEAWNITRTAYNQLGISAYNATYTYKFGADQAEKVSDSPGSDAEGRFYLDSPDEKRAVYVENRDGKGVLYATDQNSDKETLLVSQSGITTPLRWLNNRTVIYRIATPTETADYAVSIEGGNPKKVVDLTNTTGVGRWQLR